MIVYLTRMLMQILIDGVPLTELDIRWFRERIGFVGQVEDQSTLHTLSTACFTEQPFLVYAGTTLIPNGY